MMSPLSDAPVQTVDLDLVIPKIQFENINDDMHSSPFSDYGMVSIDFQQIYPSFSLKSRGQVKGRLGNDEPCVSFSSSD